MLLQFHITSSPLTCKQAPLATPKLIQDAPHQIHNRHKVAMKQAQSKTECLAFLMLVFCRHVESLETNHPQPGKPCVEVELR